MLRLENVSFVDCVKAVFIVSVGGGISSGLGVTKNAKGLVVCVSRRFMTSSYTLFTTAFALVFGSVFNLLGAKFVPILHTTYKYDNELYKLITVADQGGLL